MPDLVHFIAPLVAAPLGFGASRIRGRSMRRNAILVLLLLPLLSFITLALVLGVRIGDLFFTALMFALMLGIPLILWPIFGFIGYDVGRRSKQEYRESRFR